MKRLAGRNTEQKAAYTDYLCRQKISFKLQILNLSNRVDTFRIHVRHFDSLMLGPVPGEFLIEPSSQYI